LAAWQHGVVSGRQLHELGFTKTAIARGTAAGRFHPVYRGVFAVGHAEIGWHGRLKAALLACGEGSVLSHATAAALLDLIDRPPALIDVISHRQTGRKVTGIRRHQVPRPLASEIVHPHRIACTCPSRTVVDMAGSMGEASLRRLVERAAVLGVLDISSIERCIERSRRRGGPLLRAILAEWRRAGWGAQGGSSPRLRSVLEARILALIVAHDLPRPRCNELVEAGGRRHEADLLWPEQGLIVEADGAKHHDNPAAFDRDRLRDRLLQEIGYHVLRVTWAQIESEPNSIVASIRRLLERRFSD
jgi:hypothetical protein